MEDFWRAHREEMPYSAGGHRNPDGKQQYLRPREWIFGPSKISVIQALTRWEELEADCEWFDWAKAEPKQHARYFVDLEDLRAFYRGNGTWTEQAEQEFLAKTPETYRGWWEFKNLPFETADIRLSALPPAVYDRSASKSVVLSGMQEALFNDGLGGRVSPIGYQVTFRDALDVDRFIQDLREDHFFRELYYHREPA